MWKNRTDLGYGLVPSYKMHSYQAYACRSNRYLLLLLLLLLFGSCSESLESYPTLINKGMLPLHTSNPYLGANLFLGHELEQSTYLFNFFQGRGAPTAIEIIDKSFESPRLLLFYPRDKEVYAADLQSSRRDKHEWIVRGPYALEREDYRTLARLESAMHGEPVFVVNGKTHKFRFQRSSKRDTKVIKPAIPSIPTPAPAPKHPPKKHPKAAKTAAVHVAAPSAAPAVTPTTAGFKPLNADQQAIAISKGFAERADNGDIIHTVKVDTETLDLVSKWYTGSPTNATEIGNFNGLVPGGSLTPGARIRLPLKLITQTKVMPDGFN